MLTGIQCHALKLMINGQLAESMESVRQENGGIFLLLCSPWRSRGRLPESPAERSVWDSSRNIPYWWRQSPQNSAGIASEWLLYSTSRVISMIIFVWIKMSDSSAQFNRELMLMFVSCFSWQRTIQKRWLNSGQIDVINMEFVCSNRRRSSRGTQEGTRREAAVFTGSVRGRGRWGG